MGNQFNLREYINKYKDEICYYNQLQIFAMSPYEKVEYLDQISKKTDVFAKELERMLKEQEEVVQEREFTPEELAEYNGSDGKEAYVAINGVVYDLSHIMAWAGGNHFGEMAGQDLSDVFADCHYGREGVLDQLPKVGVLKKTST